MQEIAPNVFIETQYDGANCGLVLTDAGGVVIDTPMIPADAKAWAAQVAEKTDNILFSTGHVIRPSTLNRNPYHQARCKRS